MRDATSRYSGLFDNAGRAVGFLLFGICLGRHDANGMVILNGIG